MKTTRKRLPRRPSRGKATKDRWAPFRRQLEALRFRLVEERRSHQASATLPIEPHSESEADSGTDEFDRDLNLTGMSAAQNLLYEVEAALRRIEDHSYGRCEVSGKPIPLARLRAVPWTRFTREVEEQVERSSDSGRIRLGELRSVRSSSRSAEEEEPEAETTTAEAASPAPGPVEALIARESAAPTRGRKANRRA